ncbi:LuxR family transcriptional regulator [Paraoerskovia sediminicola]|uniref:LuxR family transcriptional regulator n=1 Tax=Paraoerskovia sediminicola TaxID=1138587 RepID=A0ABM8G296_9CELL|nr:LuxR family transcriptional regulator [Paraoerskovia sediminicola]
MGPAEDQGRRPAPHEKHSRAAARTLAGGGSVVVAGPPGVGKTHLLGDALRRAGASGVVTVTGTDVRVGEPLRALSPLLGARRADEPTSVVAGRLADALGARAPGAPRILRAEDAHLLDDGTADVLAWAARQGDLQVAVSMRTQGLSREPWAGLWRDGVVERVDLAPFTRDEVEERLVELLQAPVATDVVHRLAAESGGNAFHLDELVRAERASGALHLHDGVWLRAAGGTVPSTRMLDLVAGDLARLDAGARDALEVLSLVEAVPLRAFLEVVSQDALATLLRHGLVDTETGPGVAGGHEVTVRTQAMYAQAVRGQIPSARRRELLGRLDTPSIDDDPAALVASVTLALNSGLTVSVERIRSATDAAFVLKKQHAVVQLSTAAIEDAKGGGASGRAMVELLLQRAEASRSMGRAAAAARDVRDALDELEKAEELTDDDLATYLRGAALESGIHHYELGLGEALRRLDAASAALVRRLGPRRYRAAAEVLESTRLTRRGWDGDPSALEPAVLLLEGTQNPQRALSLVAPTILALGHAGRVAEGLGLARRYAPIGAAHTDLYRWAVGEIGVAAFFVALNAGVVPAEPSDYDDPAAAVGSGSTRDPLDPVAVHVRRGLIAAARGSWRTAAADFHAASASFGVVDLGGLLSFTLAAGARACAAAGESVAARSALDRLSRTRLRAARSLEPDIRLLCVDALAWLRDPALDAELQDLAAWARARGAARVELEALHRRVVLSADTAKILGLDAVVARCHELGGIVEGARATALVAHVVAVTTGDEALREISVRGLGTVGLWLPTPSPAVALTQREREVAALAAGGLSSKAIAERLTLSVRTVDSHLSRVFAKTGVHSRQELARALR